MKRFLTLCVFLTLSACSDPAEIKDSRYGIGQYNVTQVKIMPRNNQVTNNASYTDTKQALESLLMQRLPHDATLPPVRLLVTLDQVGSQRLTDGAHKYSTEIIDSTIAGTVEIRGIANHNLVAQADVRYTITDESETFNPSAEYGSTNDNITGEALSAELSNMTAENLGSIAPNEAKVQEGIVEIIIEKFYPEY